jgi:hypothetical protein
MSTRVLSTAEARDAVTKMQSILDGGLPEQINSLVQTGQTLSEPNIWDGPLAGRFRDSWPQVATGLNKTLTNLKQLQGEVKQINQDIMSAGGGA